MRFLSWYDTRFLMPPRAFRTSRSAELPDRSALETAGDTFSLPEITKAAVDHFSEQPALMRVLLEGELYSLFYRITQKVVADGRYVTIGHQGAKANPEGMKKVLNERARSVFANLCEQDRKRLKRLKKLIERERS